MQKVVEPKELQALVDGAGDAIEQLNAMLKVVEMLRHVTHDCPPHKLASLLEILLHPQCKDAFSPFGAAAYFSGKTQVTVLKSVEAIKKVADEMHQLWANIHEEAIDIILVNAPGGEDDDS